MNKRQKKNVDHLNDSRRITRSMSLGYENSLPFPIDIIIMIFSKLSLKSIARCRCVSKLWSSILSRSDFTELFLSKSSSRGPKLLFAIRSPRGFFISSSLQLQNANENSSLVVSNYQMKFSLNQYFEECEHVNGLICLKDLRIVKRNKEIVLKICNPSTGQMLTLPKLKTRRHSSVWSVFGYDLISKQYKVLAMTKGMKNGWMCDEYQVMTVGSGYMSWKMIDCIPHEPPCKKICINGVIYYTSISWLRTTCLIVCFDVRFEKFNFIKTNETINSSVPYGTKINLINFNGKLGFLLCDDFALFDGRSRSFKLWVLEDIEKQVWSDHIFLFPSMPEKSLEKILVNFVGVTQTNEIVLSNRYERYPLYIFYLNIERKTFVRVTIKEIETPLCGRYYAFLNHVEDVKLYENE